MIHRFRRWGSSSVPEVRHGEVQIRLNVRVTNGEENEGPLIHDPKEVGGKMKLPHQVTLSLLL
jgi:hypothetical protein